MINFINSTLLDRGLLLQAMQSQKTEIKKPTNVRLLHLYQKFSNKGLSKSRPKKLKLIKKPKQRGIF